MFFLYHHHDLDCLGDLLAALLARRERAHPLQPDTVIVPNRSVSRWLQMRLAESAGVAANLDMPLPARYIWQLIPAILPERPEATHYERARLRWHLYAVLPEVAKQNDAVASYLDGKAPEIHRLQLAERLADVFDQYLIFRPSMLADWEAGREGENTTERWQSTVWRALTARLSGEHRAQLLQRFVEHTHRDDATLREQLPDALYCFGLSQLPPEYVKFLYVLARHTDVHFLLPNPCDGYWGDIQTRRIGLDSHADDPAPVELSLQQDHPLLASFGRGTRDLLRVLYSDELSAIHEPELGEAMAYEPPAGDALLARVQADLIRMQAPREQAGMAAADVSIQVHACHGPLREVQVLQDQLLDLLSRDSELQPRDILVMLPRITDYAPAIHSVFGATAGDRFLPFTLSDRERRASHPVAQSFQRLLDLPLSRWGASEILELAAVPAVMRRFGLDEPALASAADWARQAGVRWGFDGETRARFGAAPIEQNSWRFGLDRLLLGLAQSDEDRLTAGVAPWSDLEGGATDALGRLWYLVDRLRHWEQALREPASAAGWQDRLNALVEELFAPDPDDHQEQAALEELRAAMAVLSDAAHCLESTALSWEAVRETLISELAQPGERQPFLSGGITFCGLMPLRAVPFKVICLLGMNDSDFPRQERNRSFNLLRRQPRLGDHSVRDDDRLLFLQALTAARQVFYISYTGQDVNSGETLPPSPVVGEWLEFLHRHYFDGHSRKDFEQRLITRQPMQPFSTRYFQPAPEQPRVFTFAREWQPAARAGCRERAAAPPFDDGSRAPEEQTEVVELDQLRRFFDHPAQYFLRERLQIRLDALQETAEDEEPLQLDGLSAWQLRDQLLSQARREGAAAVVEEPDALWRARGVLPPPPLDTDPFAEQAVQVNALLPIWQHWRAAGEPGHVDIDLTLASHRLVGRIANVWPDGPRILRPGSLRMKYRLRAWIDYLAYRAAGHPGCLRLAGLKDGAAITFSATLDEQSAGRQLAVLIDLYQQGLQAPLLFLPDLADHYLEQLAKGKEPRETLDRLNAQLTSPFASNRDADSPYFTLLTSTLVPLGSTPEETRFCELAEAICGPLVSALKEGDAA